MPNDIFYFLQSDWLQQRTAFYDISTSLKVIFQRQTEEQRQFSNSKHYPKIESFSILSTPKFVKFSELTLTPVF